MIQNLCPITQAFLGTLFTWGLTAAGAGMIVVIGGSQRKLLDLSLGFAGGVMTAASYWSLLAPAIEMAAESKSYGQNGEYAFIPSVVGFLIGAFFVCATDLFISSLGAHSPYLVLAFTADNALKEKRERVRRNNEDLEDLVENTTTIDGFSDGLSNSYHSRRRTAPNAASSGKCNNLMNNSNYAAGVEDLHKNPHWKRIVLLIVAITVHNIPEGLAVGVGFGAIGSSATATFESARNLAIGIGLQNFPEGLAVSLPLKAAGFSTWRSFWYGQLSGMVEPIFGVLGAAAVSLSQPVLPYALAFAAGAMIYVVVDDIIPEANSSGNGKLSTWGFISGFIVMMVLDVGLG